MADINQEAEDIARFATQVKAAGLVFELYSAYVAAGFTPEQAMELMKTMIAAQLGG